jgi:serine/threonine protein phosphatase 1
MHKHVTYAIGDVHGRLDCLKQLWAKIESHAKQNCEVFTVVFLGDYIDRGIDSCGVISFVINLQKDYDVIALKGNHEQMWLDSLRDSDDRYFWTSNGGTATEVSYDVSNFESAEQRYNVMSDHITWLETLPLTYETDTHFFVHAGIHPNIALADQHEGQLLWIRDPFLLHMEPFEKFIVHGHTIWHYDQYRLKRKHIRCNVDSGAFYSGKLTAAVIPAGCTGYPEDFLQASEQK